MQFNMRRHSATRSNKENRKQQFKYVIIPPQCGQIWWVWMTNEERRVLVWTIDDATPFLSVHSSSSRRYGCRSSSGWLRPRPLLAMSSLAIPEVASKTMVASALQPVQHDDELRLGALVQRGRRSAVCWLAPCRRLALSLAWPPYLSHTLCKEYGWSVDATSSSTPYWEPVVQLTIGGV